MMKDVINFIYVGRLEHEKGFDLIIELLRILFFENEKYKDRSRFFIFGDGSLKRKFLDSFDGISEIYEGNINNLLKKEYKSINYFGRQDRQLVDEVLSNSQFALIPSRFLETFGLVGLEACEKGIPVIGFAKGGLSQFILPELDINGQAGDTDVQKLFNLVLNICDEMDKDEMKSLGKKSSEISKRFGEGIWIKSFKEIFHGKKILLVSDFLPNIGGIEVYIKNISEILKKEGYQVEVFGRNGFFGKINKYIKILGIFVGLVNFVYAFLLNKKIKEFKPDLVRYHSVVRFLGRAPLFFNRNGNFQKWIMYHDFGYFCPYPSKLYDIEIVNKRFNIKNFFGQIKHFNIARSILIFFKFLSCRMLYLNLRKSKMNKHLVPSEFMVEILIRQYDLHRSQITVLPHFKK